jgi:hypothetical protein
MQSWTLQRGRPVAPLFNIHSARPCHGMLLALDGRHLDRAFLPLAVQVCRPVGKRLDILLVNPLKPATLMLWPFLQELEREGIDYRLTSCEGELAEELTHYVHRFRHISCILLDRLDARHTGLHPALHALRQEGYEVLTLAACRTLGSDSENWPRRDQFLPDLQPHSPAMGQKAGEKWADAVGLQPEIPKSDRLLGQNDPLPIYPGDHNDWHTPTPTGTMDSCPIWKAAGAFPRLSLMDDCRQISRGHAPTLDEKHLRTSRKPATTRRNFTARYPRQHPLQS